MIRHSGKKMLKLTRLTILILVGFFFLRMGKGAGLTVVLVLTTFGDNESIQIHIPALPVLAGTDDHQDIVPVIDIGIMIRQRNPHRAGIGRDTPLTIHGAYNGAPP